MSFLALRSQGDCYRDEEKVLVSVSLHETLVRHWFLLSVQKWISHNLSEDNPHKNHACDDRTCPLQCLLCERKCLKGHFHGLTDDMHFCEYVFVIFFSAVAHQSTKSQSISPLSGTMRATRHMPICTSATEANRRIHVFREFLPSLL